MNKMIKIISTTLSMKNPIINIKGATRAVQITRILNKRFIFAFQILYYWRFSEITKCLTL
jgi:hypothetical protein